MTLFYTLFGSLLLVKSESLFASTHVGLDRLADHEVVMIKWT
jgi:hypothetical protein